MLYPFVMVALIVPSHEVLERNSHSTPSLVAIETQHRQAQIHPRAVAAISQNCIFRRVRDIVAVRNRPTQRRAKDGRIAHTQ